MTRGADRRVVITATALLSPAGLGPEPVLRAMDDGRTVLGRPGTPPELLAWPSDGSWSDNAKYVNDTGRIAVALARALCGPAGTGPFDGSFDGAGPRGGSGPCDGIDDPDRCGIVLGADITAVEELGAHEPDGPYAHLAHAWTRAPGPLAGFLFDEVPDFSYLRGIPSLAGLFVSRVCGFTGSNVAVCADTSAQGLGALSLASRMITSGELDRVLVLAVAPRRSTPRLTATDLQDSLGVTVSPGAGPFDRDRAGVLPAVGGAAVCLEASGVAGARGAAPVAELAECQTWCATDRAEALALAGRVVVDRAAGPIGAWWASANGSVSQDHLEAGALAGVVRCPVTSSRGTLGTLFEAAGLADVVLAARLLGTSRVPPVGLLRVLDPALAPLDVVHGSPRTVPPLRRVAVSAMDHGVDATCAGAALLEEVGRP